MHPQSIHQVAGPAQVTPIVAFHDVSKWYGNVIGINKLTLRIGRASPGCSAPTAPAKSRCCNWRPASCGPARARSAYWGNACGTTPPQSLDRPLPRARRLLRMDDRLGLRVSPARGSAACRVHAARTAAERTIESVGMTQHQDRAIRGYSKGMRQRIKLAQALGARPGGAVSRRAADGHRPGGPPRPDGHHHAARAAKAKACSSRATCCTKCNR